MKDRIDAILQRSQAEYLEKLTPSRDPLLMEMERFAEEEGHPIADPEVAHFLALLARMQKPRRIVEVGTNIGYSVVVMGRESDDAATIETIEIDRDILGRARDFVSRAQLGCRVKFHEGAALEVLGALEGTIDFAFIDCVKTEYGDYLSLLLERMKSGGVVVADNVLWKGLVATAVTPDGPTAALREFNRRITTDERLFSMVLPVGDGLSISVVK